MNEKCVICLAPCVRKRALCDACGRAYDRWNLLEEETMGLIVWVAARTRRLCKGKCK